MKLLPNWMARRPHVAELDLSGVVVAQKDTEFKEGDEVFGWAFGEQIRILDSAFRV